MSVLYIEVMEAIDASAIHNALTCWRPVEQGPYVAAEHPMLGVAETSDGTGAVFLESAGLRAREARACRDHDRPGNAIARLLHDQVFVHNPVSTLRRHSINMLRKRVIDGQY
jgi:hypothetical protein